MLLSPRDPAKNADGDSVSLRVGPESLPFNKSQVRPMLLASDLTLAQVILHQRIPSQEAGCLSELPGEP